MSTSERHVDPSESEQLWAEREIHPINNGRPDRYAASASAGPEEVPVNLIEAWRQWAESRLG